MTTLRIGSRGDAVKVLQEKLHLHIDGIFGTITREAVIAFQKQHGLTPDGIVGSKTWEELGIKAQNKRTIDKIIIHCAATPEGKDFTVNQIRQWHLARGFSDIGYHYVIYRDGSIHKGRDEAIIGAHTTGQNSHSIGICYIGGLAADGKTPKDTRTHEQKVSLINLIKELKLKYPGSIVYGHRDYANKACPSFDARKEYKNL